MPQHHMRSLASILGAFLLLGAMFPAIQTSAQETEPVAPDAVGVEAAVELTPEPATRPADDATPPISPAVAAEGDAEPDAADETVAMDPPSGEEPVAITLPHAAVRNGEAEDTISITLDDVSLTDVVNLFIRVSGANIIASPADLVGRVTVSIRDVHWQEALSSILDLHNLMLERTSLDANLFKIVPKPEGAPEPLFVEAFRLQFIRATDHDRALTRGIERLLAPNGSLLYAGGNTISILGTTRQVELVRRMIERVDQRIPQVIIEAKFVELNDEAIRDLGINWQALQGYTVGAGELMWGFQTGSDIVDRTDAQIAATDRTRRFFDMRGTQFQVDDDGTVTPTRDPIEERSRETTRQNIRTIGQFQSAILTADAFSLTLSALQQQAGIGIISNPKIIVASGQTANIHVGQQDPEIKAVADTNLGGRLTYQREGWIESGVKLDVTPVVNTDDIISVQIRPELSRVIGFVETGDSRVTIPRLSTRMINSHFHLPSGRTVAIGGLTETRDRNQETRVPFLGDIPLLGRLFRHSSTAREQEEVIIFVTLALADTDGLMEESGIPTQGLLIHRNVETEDGRMRIVSSDRNRRRESQALGERDPHAPVPRR